MTVMRGLVVVWLVIGTASAAFGQSQQQSGGGGIPVTESDRLRINARFMAAYGYDKAHHDIGNEAFTRVGYAIVELSGKISDRFSYRFDFNPVNETQPIPSCGELDFFYPNEPQTFGPNVQCDNDGRMRVDDYRFTGLDLINQQGPIRQAYVGYRSTGGLVTGKFGQFILPVGFDWEEMGSYTSKDATHIQRINAEANFGVMMAFNWSKVTLHTAAFKGDGNRFHDYDYFYSLDSSFDTNSAISALFVADLRLLPGLDIRASQKSGYSGSKVERLPNFYASKHIDHSSVLSARYRPIPEFSVFSELAWYTWGLTETSAELIGLTDTDPVKKNGYYVGADFNVPVMGARLGTTVTYESLDRDDALIKYLFLQDLYNVTMGEKETGTVFRAYLDFGKVQAAFFYNKMDNPFPWVSGSVPVSGERAYSGYGSNKWGFVGRFALDKSTP